MESCLDQVAAYRASGQEGHVWAEANGVPPRALASWCAHARRLQARLDGVSAESSPTRPSGFVVARVALRCASPSVRIELSASSTRLDVHWPLSHTVELAALLRKGVVRGTLTVLPGPPTHGASVTNNADLRAGGDRDSSAAHTVAAPG